MGQEERRRCNGQAEGTAAQAWQACRVRSLIDGLRGSCFPQTAGNEHDAQCEGTGSSRDIYLVDSYSSCVERVRERMHMHPLAGAPACICFYMQGRSRRLGRAASVSVIHRRPRCLAWLVCLRIASVRVAALCRAAGASNCVAGRWSLCARYGKAGSLCAVQRRVCVVRRRVCCAGRLGSCAEWVG